MLKPRGRALVPRHLAERLAASLRLRRPLVFLDLETTGLDPGSDRIVEIAALRIGADGRAELLDSLVDPEIVIPPAAERVHGIDAARVSGAPLFGSLAPLLIRFLADADLAGYNLIRFDLPLLQAELGRAGFDLALSQRRLVDPCALFKLRERRDLTAAYRFYCGAEIGRAHAALGDVIATAHVLAAQLDRYPDLEPDVAAIDRLLRPAAAPLG